LGKLYTKLEKGPAFKKKGKVEEVEPKKKEQELASPGKRIPKNVLKKRKIADTPIKQGKVDRNRVVP